MKWRAVIRGSVIAAGSWAIGYGSTVFLASGTVSEATYAFIVGWWFAAFMSAKLNIQPASAFLLSIAYFALFALVAGIGKSWLYRDIYGISYNGLALVALGQSVIVGSPILFNWLVTSLVNKRWRPEPSE